jgi:hypothetical protein
MIGDVLEDVGESGLGTDSGELCCIDEGVNGSIASSAFVRTCEGPVLAANGNGAQLALCGIFGHAESSIIEEALSC